MRNSRHAARPVAVLLCALVLARISLAALPQDPSPTAIDLRLVPRVGEPVLGKLESQVKGTVDVTANKKSMKMPLEIATHLAFVDEFLSLDTPAQGDFEARRTYLAWQEDDKDKGPRDNELSGVRASIHRRAGEYTVELDRLARSTQLQRVVAQDISILGCALPAAVEPGASFAIEPTALAFLLVDEDLEMANAKGTFTLKTVDAAGLATLEGQLTALTKNKDESKEEDKGNKDKRRAMYEGACTLVVDTRAHALQSAEWKGQANFSGEMAGAVVKGAGAFESRLALSTGAPAREALASAVEYRAVRREPDTLPVSLDLPSHWYEREAKDAELFTTALHGDEQVVLELSAFDVPHLKHEAAFDEAFKQLKTDTKLTDVKVVTCPLGKGRSARFHIDVEGQKQPYDCLMELYPLGPDRLLCVRLYGTPKGVAEELDAWPAIKKSLRKRE